MKLERKTFPMEVKEVSDSGEFSGYLSVFGNEDAYGDVVMPGAFKDSLKEWEGKGKLPPILWQHNWHEPVGPFTKLIEDKKGLYFEGKLLIADVQRAREAHALVKNNVVSGMSMGFNTLVQQEDHENNTRQLLKVKLWEGSIATFPANEEAQIEAVKSILDSGVLPDLKTFEKFLREAGFSKSQAAAVANHGLSYLLRSESEGAGDEQVAALVANLKSTNWSFK
jgi:HK97 family phage prohead protease